MKAKTVVFIVLLLVGITFSLVLAGNYQESNCDHRIWVPIPGPDNESGVWLTTDPAQIITESGTYTLLGKAFILGHTSFTLGGVPVNNTWGCYYGTDYYPSQTKVDEIVLPLNPLECVFVGENGEITVNAPVEGTCILPELPTPTPTNTFTPGPTATSTSTPEPTETPVPTPTPPLLPTPNPDLYIEDGCDHHLEFWFPGPSGLIASWLTSDPATIVTDEDQEDVSSRMLVVGHYNFRMSNVMLNNTWGCYYGGQGWYNPPTSITDGQVNEGDACVFVADDGQIYVTESVAGACVFPSPPVLPNFLPLIIR
jgi:hypothetical protein